MFQYLKKLVKNTSPLFFIWVGAVSLAGLLTLTSPVQTLEYNMRDQLFHLRGPLNLSDSPVVLVTISQQADKEIPYKYPWPTDLYARLIENLNKAGAKAIGIDVIFDQPDTYDPKHDTLFARALKKYKNVVLAGKIFKRESYRAGGARSAQISKVEPLPLLKNYNPNPFGIVTNSLDHDEVLRRYLLFNGFLDQRYYALGLETIRIAKGFSYKQVEKTEQKLRWGPFDIPLARARSMYINYYAPAGGFPRYSFEKVIDDSTFQTNFEKNSGFAVNSFNAPEVGLLQRGVFEDKIVLVGATMPELHDFHATPYSGSAMGAMPGVEVHANAVQTILDRNYLHVMTESLKWVLMLLFTLLMVWATSRLNLWISSGMLALFGVGYLIAGIWLFVDHNYIVLFTGPLAAPIFGFFGTLGYDYIREQREKKRIKGMFQSYVSPALVEQMVESDEEPKLGGEKQYLTALFSDIQSFSTIAEQLEAERLVRLINDYLTNMTDIIHEQGGTLDKYIGDAIVAFYGAPVYFEDHAYRACVTSRLMQRKLDELCRKWEHDEEQWPEIVYHMKNRIGINTGDMVTGNMGSQRRFNYTMMGDHVNLAARCESASKSYGIYTMVTEYTKNEAERYGDRCVFRFLDKIVVKGKSEPVDVYEIFGLREEIGEKDKRCIEVYEEGLHSYLEQDWSNAITRFEESAYLEPNQPNGEYIKTNPSQLMIDRCRQLQQEPPAEDWNGVYVMTHK